MKGGGRPEFATNDRQGNETVADAINAMIENEKHRPDLSVAISSAYFNVGGWVLIEDKLKQAQKVRVLLGAEPQRDTDPVVLRPSTVTAKKALARDLMVALADQEANLSLERNLVGFTKVNHKAVADLVAWLRSGTVEVRRYTTEFLHGKAYLLEPSLGVIAGSSNFTYAGLAKNRELNLGQYNPSAIQAVQDWYEDLWDASEPFDLAAFYEQMIVPESPWIVFLRMLWEAYGRQVQEDASDVLADSSLRGLLDFQRDGVARARRIMDKHNGVLIADEVGLGKTYLGGALIKDVVRSRRRVLIVAPKIIRDSVWKPYVDQENLAGWVDVISYDDLINRVDDTAGVVTLGAGLVRDVNEYSLVVLDEAHTVRNTDTQRAHGLIEILKGNPRKQVILLTATPVNNQLGDLHSLLSYFVVHDDEFASLGIPSLAAHFRAADKMNPDDLSPEHLFDILDQVAVRRTRRFVRNQYVGQQADEGTVIRFPQPVVERINYDLTPALSDFFDRFAHALGADTSPDDGPDPFFSGGIPEGGLSTLDGDRLTLAGYTPSRYLMTVEDNRQRAAEVQVAGLLRSGLLKRFESSGYAFTATCRKMAATLQGLLNLIDDEGVVASGADLRDYVRTDLDDPVGLQEWKASADYQDAADFDIVALRADITSDIRILTRMASEVDSSLKPETDPKLEALREALLAVVWQAQEDARKRLAEKPDAGEEALESRERDDRKVMIFSYFADTVDYLQQNIERVLDDPELEPYLGRIAFVTGSPKRGNLAATTVDQAEAVAGFAPRTGGPRKADGTPTHPDMYDLLVSTDVLSEGVNLQQAHNIINYDLPWNPQRLVQRHGRQDRIGSQHDFLYVYCFFPDRRMDDLLSLETILHKKLVKAARSIGAGKVLPGVDASDDVVFTTKREVITNLAEGDNSLFLGQIATLMSGEEFRAMLRHAIENESLSRRLEEMPWGIGSGFAASDRSPGIVFCARILNRTDEPTFRFVALPQGFSLTELPPTADDNATDRPTINGYPVDIVSESLTALTIANPPTPHQSATLPDEWIDVAYSTWELAQHDIVNTWNNNLDTTGDVEVQPIVRAAKRHLTEHANHRDQQEVGDAIKIYSRPQAARVAAVIRAVMKDEGLKENPTLLTDRLLELVDELGLSVPEKRERRYPIGPDDVHLIAWLAVQPQ